MSTTKYLLGFSTDLSYTSGCPNHIYIHIGKYYMRMPMCKHDHILLVLLRFCGNGLISQNCPFHICILSSNFARGVQSGFISLLQFLLFALQKLLSVYRCISLFCFCNFFDVITFSLLNAFFSFLCRIYRIIKICTVLPLLAFFLHILYIRFCSSSGKLVAFAYLSLLIASGTSS